ncbi:hypothetical protein BSR08_00005 [Bacillus subtilis]|nr:hypothetical protein BSR08_00005 [Bacillus subtilis]
MRDQQPLIEQASIFLNSPRPLVLSPEYSALTEQEALRKYRSLLSSDHSIYWKRSGNQAMLIQLIPGAAEKPFGAIMLAVDPKEMESILQSLSPYPDGSALLWFFFTKKQIDRMKKQFLPSVLFSKFGIDRI